MKMAFCIDYWLYNPGIIAIKYEEGMEKVWGMYGECIENLLTLFRNGWLSLVILFYVLNLTNIQI